VGTVQTTSGFVTINDTSLTPPPLTGSVSLGSNYSVGSRNTRANFLTITADSSAGSGQSWSVSSGGIPVQFGAGNGSSGTFSSGQSVVCLFGGPHSGGTVSVSISKSGYTNYNSGGISVPALSVYSPYTVSTGFTQESGYTTALANSVLPFYAGNGTYTVTGGGLRYQLFRAPEYGGFAFWCGFCISNGVDPSSALFRDSFGAASESQTGPKTSYQPGTGWNTLSDRP
jgi:hypothetical protein